MRTSNPVFGDQVYNLPVSGGQSMTVQGTVNKSFVLLALALVPAFWVWNMVLQPARTALGFEAEAAAPAVSWLMPLIIGSGIAGFVVAMVTVFKKEWSSITAPLYAVLEGVLIGGISAFFERMYPGIVIQAIALTFGTMFCMLMAYKSGAIRVTEKFRLGMFAATGAIALIYLVTFVLGFFKVSVPYIHEGGTIGILFSVFVVAIAALNLVLDFDNIDRGAEAGAPKYMEWYSAFGLMVTLVWLYFEILKLLAKMRGRD